MHNTKVKDLMEEELVMASPDDTLYQASKKMKEAGCGCLPVGTGDRAEGIVTDRDIVTRAVAHGLDPAIEQVRDHMTAGVKSCGVNDTVYQAASKMRDHGVSRLLVVDEEGRTCGILSFGRIMRNFSDAEEINEVVTRVTGKDPDTTAVH